MDQLSQLIEQYGIYAVFGLCTVEGDITLLISGALAHSSFFGEYSLLKVFAAGILGGMVGDCFGYFVGRMFHETVKNYRFYSMAQPRIERLIEKFGAFAIIISKYIYGIRVAMCVFYGVGRMPVGRFLLLDFISCTLWVMILSGVGYFFSGAISSIIGDFTQIGIALFFIILTGIIFFYVIERFWLSEKVEESDPDPRTIHKLEETLHAVEDIGKNTLHDIGERLHLTREPNKDDISQPETEQNAERGASAGREK